MAPDVLVSKELWLGHLYLVVMKQKVWNGLAQEDKEAITRAANIAYKTAGSVMEGQVAPLLDALRQNGATVRVLQHSEVAHWQEVTRYQQIQANWVKKQQADGIQDAAPVMQKVSKIMAEVMQ